ncbi:MAG: homoserine dehydrogenase [Gemmatimonadaceae bacterium]
MTSVAGVECREQEPWQGETRTVVRIALAGCGSVGSALLREIAARREAIADRHGVEIVLTRLLVRDVDRKRDASFDPALLTNDVEEFLATDADIVVEAIGGLDPARRIAETVLGRGQKLVTANKLLLAAHGSLLTALARRNGTSLRYDAAVGGGVPILRVLDESLGAGGPARVRGILNGTANFVLTRIEGGASLEEALDEARVAGFAEADASRDLDGRDAADKIALVAWAAFGVAPESVAVRRSSLLPEPERFVRLASRLGARVRHVAECSLVGGEVVAAVEPLFVAPESALARTRDEGNHVDVFAGWRAPLCASGPGAGGLPTATALLSDLVCTSTAPRRTTGVRVAAADVRELTWAIEVRAEPAVLHRSVPNCALVHTNDTASESWTIIRATTPSGIAGLLTTLEAAGATPIVARFDEALS